MTARTSTPPRGGPWSVARRLLGRRLNGPGVPRALQIRIANATLAYLSATAPQASVGSDFRSPGTGYTALSLKLVVPSTGLEEFFTLHVPEVPSGGQAPLVVAFHSFDRTHLEIYGETDLLDEAARRGWFLLAPVQRSAVGNPLVNYGSVQSQDHVEAVMDWVLDTFDVDRDRVYGVGFSMGGGSAMSYAARHRDPRVGAFAAVANHTGTVGLAHVHAADPGAASYLEVLFGGAPDLVPFDYQRCSTVELDGAGAVVAGGRHMAINLGFTPVRTYYATNDFLGYLQLQSQSLHGFMNSVPSLSHRLFPVLAPVVPCQVRQFHCWASMPTTEVFDWFETLSLVPVPPFGSVLADRDGNWSGIEVVQERSGEFSTFDYALSSATGTVELRQLDNVRSLEVDLSLAGFDPAQAVTVQVDSTDGTGHRIFLRGLDAPPGSVFRNGLGAIQTCMPGLFPTWCYDGASRVLTLYEPTGVLGDWQIFP